MPVVILSSFNSALFVEISIFLFSLSEFLATLILISFSEYSSSASLNKK